MKLKPPRAGGGLFDPPGVLDARVGRALTLSERITIEVGVRLGWPLRRIGEQIGRDKSVVSREIRRNQSAGGEYYASIAHARAHQHRHRPKPFKLSGLPELCRRIEGWMDEGWSPRLIARVLAEEAPNDHTRRVSHETIYQALYCAGTW